jgi:hypothetical protein
MVHGSLIRDKPIHHIDEQDSDAVPQTTSRPQNLVLPEALQERPLLDNDAECMLDRDANASHLRIPCVLGCCQLAHTRMGTHNVCTHTVSRVPIQLNEPSLGRIALLRSGLDGVVVQVLVSPRTLTSF